MIKREIHIFFTALMFYTRIPCPRWVGHSQEMLNKATRYFPLMGWIVGGISGLIWLGAGFILPNSISVILSMIVSMLLTGAFHEDGFADMVDGFGGGYTKEKILTIMKDSRIGVFGAIALVMILLFKFHLLKEIQAVNLLFVLLAGHSISRLAPTFLIYWFNYARDDEKSKVKPIGKGISMGELITASVFGLLPFLFLDWIFSLSIVPLLIISISMGKYFKRKIGGYTGDCLGAVQQITEISFYLFVLITCQFLP